MVVLAPLLAIGGIALFCWLIFSVAIYALPVMTGVVVFLRLMEADAGWFVAILAGLMAGCLALALAQMIFASARSVWLRFTVALVFAAPAVVAGYGATMGLSQLVVASPGWQTAFSVVGAAAVGMAAWARIVATPPGMSARSIASGN